MAINIRELFNADSENVRLEKINYNFDQIVANGGGPIGLQGAKGDVGPTGVKGQKGEIGDQGLQGPAGISTDYFYKEEHSATQDNNILVPLADSDHTLSPSMMFGVWTDGIDVSQVSNYDSTPVLIKFDKGIHTAAFRLSEDDFDSGMDIKWENNVSTSDMTFNAVGLANPVNYLFKGNSIIVNVGGVNKVVMGSDSTFNNNAIFNSGLKLTTGAAANKFLKSDASGNASWSVIGTAVPIGTIVMVGPSVLANNVTWNDGGVIPSFVGRGTGDWAGWYFCWGQTWGVGGASTYVTPDLRERYPIGYAGTSGTLLSGSSDEAKYAASGVAIHSTSGTAGYYGTNDIDQLQSKQTASNHTHNVTFTPQPATEPDIIGVDTDYASNSSTTSTSTSNGQTVSDITPRSAVLGFMIYLGASNLAYGAVQGGGPTN